MGLAPAPVNRPSSAVLPHRAAIARLRQADVVARSRFGGRPRPGGAIGLASTLAALLLLGAPAGCIELRDALAQLVDGGGNGGTDGPTDGGNGNGNTNDNQPPENENDNGAGATPPEVEIAVSNPVPQVSEEVILTCTVVEGESEDGVTYDFSPSARLTIDAEAGQARFVIDQADVDTPFSFTCTGTRDGTTGPPSAAVTFIPAGPPPEEPPAEEPPIEEPPLEEPPLEEPPAEEPPP
jgi:hypothetical protein